MKFCIIGCGNIAKKHVHSIKNVPIASLVGVCDIDPDVLKTSQKTWDVPGFNDYIAMINATHPDVVVVLTSSGSHASIVRTISPLVSRIIVEKPLSLRIDDAQDMIESCKRDGTQLSVVKQNRFNLPITYIKRLINENAFGRIFLGSIRMRWSRSQSYYDSANWRGTWKHDGGVLANQGIHFVDMIQWLVGDIESVFAQSINASLDIEAEDTLVSTVKFKNGALATFEFTTATQPKDIEGSISILGTKGTACIGGFAMNKLEYLDTDSGIENEISLESQNNPNNFAFAHEEFYRAYLDTSNSYSSFIADGEEALKSLKIIHAIYQSIELNAEIRVDDVQPSKLGA
jgi:UDP-N-acetyl-2-amino-2-deoxyglucuronate dehydrogenase